MGNKVSKEKIWDWLSALLGLKCSDNLPCCSQKMEYCKSMICTGKIIIYIIIGGNDELPTSIETLKIKWLWHSPITQE